MSSLASVKEKVIRGMQVAKVTTEDPFTFVEMELGIEDDKLVGVGFAKRNLAHDAPDTMMGVIVAGVRAVDSLVAQLMKE